MNRSSNLLNGSLLGSSGRTSRIFMYATQWCTANITARLHAGRKLQSVSTPTQVTGGFKLQVTRKLKAVAQVSVALTARLHGRVAVSIQAAMLAATVFTMQLQTRRAQHLQVLASIGVSSSAVLQKRHPVALAASRVFDVTTTVTLRRGSPLVVNSQAGMVTSVILNESSRVHAPDTRTAYVAENPRIVVISGQS